MSKVTNQIKFPIPSLKMSWASLIQFGPYITAENKMPWILNAAAQANIYELW